MLIRMTRRDGRTIVVFMCIDMMLDGRSELSKFPRWLSIFLHDLGVVNPVLNMLHCYEIHIANLIQKI